MLSIQLDAVTEGRLSAVAKLTGQTEEACARDLIAEHLSDLEDRLVAERRLDARRPPLTSQQVRRELGLEN